MGALPRCATPGSAGPTGHAMHRVVWCALGWLPVAATGAGLGRPPRRRDSAGVSQNPMAREA
eukprot:306266-Alexandrium_andersonii.AAC.1